jgi:transcriptional regulator with XRE-family HTH domain
MVAKDYKVIYYGCKQIVTRITKGGHEMQISLKDSENLRKMLLVSGHTLRSFAEKVGLSSPYFIQIINNKRNPSAKAAKKITDGLALEFDDIFFIHTVSKSDHSGECHEEK